MSRILLKLQWALQRKLGLRFSKSLSMPDRVSIEVTNRCNSNCAMCNRANLADLGKDMPLELFKELACQLEGSNTLIATGAGEPLLHPDLPEMVEFANDYIPVTFTTNGILLNGKNLDKIASMPLEELSCSIHSSNPKVHRKILPGADLEKVLNSLRHIQKNGRFPVMIKTVVMSSNLETIYDLPNLLAEYDLGHLNLYPVVGLTDFAMRESLPRERNFYKGFHAEMKEKCRQVGIKLGPMNEALYWNECYSPWIDAFINYKGNLTPCCKLSELGIAEARNFKSAWNGEKMRDWRKKLANGIPPHRMCREVCLKYS